MATILSICQDVADKVGLTRPLAVVGSSLEDSRRLIALAKSVGEDLRGRHRWQFLKKEATITTVASQEAYDLPADYDYMIPDTLWDETEVWRSHGPAIDQRWQFLKKSSVSVGVYTEFIIRGNQVLLNPIPSASGDELSFMYISTGWIEDASTGARRDTFSADTDIVLFASDIMKLGLEKEWYASVGEGHSRAEINYERRVSDRISHDIGMKKLSANRCNVNPVLLNYPQNGYGT